MEENKFCPILSTSKLLSENNGICGGLVLCEKDKCEWWCKVNKCCIVHSLSCLTGIGMPNL